MIYPEIVGTLLVKLEKASRRMLVAQSEREHIDDRRTRGDEPLKAESYGAECSLRDACAVMRSVLAEIDAARADAGAR